MLFTLLAFAVAIGLLVCAHEYGHYWVARRCGVHIERFSFGMGKVLLKRTDKRGCEWALSMWPVGGYVMMRSQVSPDAPQAIKDSSFESKSLAQRAAITAAGPAASLLLAVVLYILMGVVGTEEPAARIAQPPAHSAAALAGLEAGDQIIAVDNKKILSWGQLRWQLLDRMHTGGDVELTVKQPNGIEVNRRISLVPTSLDPDAQDPLRTAGLTIFMPQPLVRQVVSDSAAAQAGIRDGDVLLAINNEPIQNAMQFVQRIQKSANEELEIAVQRQGQTIIYPVRVAAYHDDTGQTIGRVGIALGANLEMVTVRYGLVASIEQGFSRTIDTFWLSLKMLGRMVTGEVSVKNISGPVSIADYAGQSARIGLAAYVHFLALISISIGLLNLLPIPMLDGGHLLYYAIEAITGKPVSDQFKYVGQMIGVGLLIALTFLAFFNDLTRLLN